MKNKKRNKVIIALIVLLLALALGYASFSTVLNINGTVNASGNWDVQFQTATLKKPTGETDSDHGNALISTDKSTNDTITATVNLKYPGDGVILEAVVVNNGNIPAKVTEFTVTGLENDKDVEITQNARPVAAGEKLLPHGTCTAQFGIKWKENSTETKLAEKTFKITYNYSQDTKPVTLNPTHNDA